MGVYIKGMEMPKSCCECAIKSWDGEDDVCPFSGISALSIGRQDDCPLVPVPPHGDLIDQDAYRDEFMDGVYDLCNDDPDNCRANSIIDLFDSAPTIIPAEEEVEKNFCGDCHWYEAEEQYCFRKGCHSYDESSCELWEPMPANEPIPAPGGKTVPTTYDLLYEEGGCTSNGV